MNATAAWFEMCKASEDFAFGGKHNPKNVPKTVDRFEESGSKNRAAESKIRQEAHKKRQSQAAKDKVTDARAFADNMVQERLTKPAEEARKKRQAAAKTKVLARRKAQKTKEEAARKKKLEEEKATRAKQSSRVARDRRAATDAARDAASEERGVNRKKTLRRVDAFADRVVSGKTRPKTKEEARERMAADKKRKDENRAAGKDHLGQGVRQQERQLLEDPRLQGIGNWRGDRMMARHRLRTGARAVPDENRLETRRETLGRNWKKVMGKDKGNVQPTLSMREGYKVNQPLAAVPEAQRKESNQKHIDRLQADVDSGKASEQTARLLESMIQERDKEADKTTEAQREQRHKDVTDQQGKLIDVLTGLQEALENQKTTDINTEA